jgi:ankyrin repeat protein
MWTERFPQLLRVAARHGSFRVAAVLVAANASVNGANSGTSPLCIASRKGHVSCVSLLLAMKACTSAAGYQSSALQRAAVFGHADVAECLLRAKADLQQPNSLNETPVYLAAARKSGEPVLRVLLDAHADVNPPSPCKSPLCGAAGNVESPGVFQLLLGARADVSGVTTFGCTALSLAVHNMCPDTVVKLLLRAKADVNAADRGEFTALHYTATRGRCITARLLVRAKADVRAKTKLGDTAANLAWTYRNFDLADYFKAVAGLSKA